MENIIYDITQDKELQKIIEERKEYFQDDVYTSKYGQYGTNKWLKGVFDNGLVLEAVGEVLAVSGTGKKVNFPIFKLKSDGFCYEFECKGNQDDYFEGAHLKVFFINKEEIFGKGFEGFQLLKVEKIN